MAGNQHPTVFQKVAKQMHLSSSLSQDVNARYGGIQRPAFHQRCFAYGNYSNAGLQNFQASQDLSLISANTSPVFVQAPQEKGLAAFATDFLIGGVSTAVSMTIAAPIACVKLLIQKQDEMIKAGKLSEPYKGIGDCFGRTIKDEGFGSLWREIYVS